MTKTIESISVYDGDTLIGVWQDYRVEADRWICRNGEIVNEPAGNVLIILSGKVKQNEHMNADEGTPEAGRD